MKLRKASRPLTPEGIRERNTERNIERIMNPPKPTLRDRIMGLAYAVEEFWRRHVTMRELFRMLDNARLVNLHDRPDPAVMLQRLREDWNSYPEYYPWGDDDDRK